MGSPIYPYSKERPVVRPTRLVDNREADCPQLVGTTTIFLSHRREDPEMICCNPPRISTGIARLQQGFPKGGEKDIKVTTRGKKDRS